MTPENHIGQRLDGFFYTVVSLLIMSPDSIVTIITGVLQAGGLAVFLLLLLRGISARLKSLETVVEAQRTAIESVQVRANEAEKIASLYKSLIGELPELLQKQKELTEGIKDDIIKTQASLLQSKDEELKRLTEESLMRLRTLEIAQKVLKDKADLVIGFDIGISSIGWAALRNDKLIDLGVRTFGGKKEG